MKKISFKISKNGVRYCPKPKPNPSVFVDDEVDDANSSVIKHHHQQLGPARLQCDYDFSKKGSVVDLTEDDDDEDAEEISDAGISFIVNIFPDGYTIDKSLKSIAAKQIALMYDPKLLRPYDRASQSLFKAIECCRVPANFFEDIPCKYKNGKVACEVRDWRKDSSEQAGVSINRLSVAAIPSIRRISLKMSVNSIVRDIPQMSKRDFWAYSELLDTEAKILLALYPKLDLDPYPDFDRLCKKPTTVKLNLDFRAMRRKRLRQTSVPEKSNLGTDQPNVANSSTQNAGQRTAMGPPNAVNLATQNVREIPTMHQLTQNVPQLPTQDQLIQNAGERPAMDQPNIANLATQNVVQCNTTVPNTSIPRFPWESPQPKGEFGVETSGNMQSHEPGTSFNAPGASSTHALGNLSSGDDDIDSFMSGFACGRRNQGSRQSSSMANLDHSHLSNPMSFVGNQQQMIASHNVLGASSSAPGASSTHAMQSSSSIMSAFDRNWSDHVALIGNHQQMTLEILDHTPGTAFNRLRASNTRSMSLPSANDGRRYFTSAFDGRTANQDGQSSFPMAYLEGRSRSNSFVFLGNQQQQQQASHMQYNAARTSVNAPGASSHGMMNLNSNNGGTGSMIPFDGNQGNQDGHSSSLVKMENGNWSNPLADVFNQHQNTPATAFSAPGASSTHGTTILNLNNDGISSIIPFVDGKMGNQDVGRSSSVANLDNRNQSNPLVYVGNQQQQIALYMQNDTSSQISAIVPEGFSTQGTMNLSSDDDIDISAILASIEANACSTMANNADNNQSNRLASNRNQPQQQIAANQQHGMVSSGSDNDCRWSAMSAFDNKRGHQDDGESSSMAKRNRLNPLAFNSNQTQQMAGRKNRTAARSSSQTERSVVNSVHAVGGSRSLSSNANNSMHPTQMAATPGPKPHQTNPILHGIGSSSTVGNTGGRSVASASVQKEPDRMMQDRFTRIELLTTRYKLNCKELKVDDCKPTINIPSSQLNHDLININNNETLIDETCKMPLSMSHAGGNVNLCKTRILKFVKEAHSYPTGNEEILVSRSETKLILSERQSDGTVTMHYCEFNDYDHSAEEELLPTFPNTHTADLFAAEFCSLMEREGYTLAGDYLQAKPVGVVQLSDGQHNWAIGPVVIAGNSMDGSQGSENGRRDAPRAGGKSASPLAILDPNPKEKKSRIAQRRSREQSSNAGGSHGGNIQVPSGSGSGSRGRGSCGRGSRGRGSRGQGSRIGNMNTYSSLTSGSGTAGSRGLLGSSTSGISMNRMQRNPMTLPRFMTEMNHQMQQQTNLQPVSLSTSASLSSNDWLDDDFMINLMK